MADLLGVSWPAASELALGEPRAGRRGLALCQKGGVAAPDSARLVSATCERPLHAGATIAIDSDRSCAAAGGRDRFATNAIVSSPALRRVHRRQGTRPDRSGIGAAADDHSRPEAPAATWLAAGPEACRLSRLLRQNVGATADILRPAIGEKRVPPRVRRRPLSR
jgi:hypothetical protein